jgi:hypothetical protein
VILILIAALAHQTPVPDTPRAFLARTYAQYRDPNFSPLNHPARTFAPVLVEAIRNDTSAGEVGYLDGDPLCDCQDYRRISIRIAGLKTVTPIKVVARLRVDLGVDQPRNLQLNLVRTNSGWRIEDVVSNDGTSLLRELKHSKHRH